MKDNEFDVRVAEKVLEQWREEKTDMQQIMIVEEYFDVINQALAQLLSGKKKFKDYKKLKEWLMKVLIQEEENHDE